MDIFDDIKIILGELLQVVNVRKLINFIDKIFITLYVIFNNCICIKLTLSFYNQIVYVFMKNKQRSLIMTCSKYSIYIIKVIGFIIDMCK